MAENRTPRAPFLKKSSSGLLKRSSSVEILTPTGNKDEEKKQQEQNQQQQQQQQVRSGEPKSPGQEKSTGGSSVQATPGGPQQTLPSSASTPSFDLRLTSPVHSSESLSSAKSHSSDILGQPKRGAPTSAGQGRKSSAPSAFVLEPKSSAPTSAQGPAKTSTPLKNQGSSETLEILPSPVTLRKDASNVARPVVGGGGHIFKVTTTDTPNDALLGPPRPQLQKSQSVDADPPVQRRKRKEPALTPMNNEENDEEDNSTSEPVWQKRLSQLFIPPSERELQRESEETRSLLPKSSPKPKVKRSREEQEHVALLNELNREPPPSTNNNNTSSSRSRSRRRQSEEGEEEEGEEEEEEDKKKEERKEKRGSRPATTKSSNRINFLEDHLTRRHNVEDADDRLSVLDKIESNDRDSDDFGTTSSSDDDEDDEDYVFRDGYTSWDDTICSNRSSYFKMYYSQRGVIGANRSEDNKSKASRASSHNSISSLIREGMGRPQLPTTKKTKADLGLMILVAVLFIIIVAGISLTSYFYNLHLLEMTIFNSIKFFEKSRVLEIYNPQWEPVATAHLGSYLPPESIPEDCTHYLQYLHKHNHTMPNDEHDHTNYEDFVCLDWTSLARLQLRKMHSAGNVQCYSIWWVAAREDFTLRDCLEVDEAHGAWWGGGEMSDGGYPVTNADVPPSYMVTGKLGINSWGQLLRRTWLSDRSSLLTLPDSFQGYVSVNHGGDGKVCVESRPHPHLKSPTPTLEYTVCTAPDLSTVSHFLHQEAISSRRIVVENTKHHVKHKVDKGAHSEMNVSESFEMQFGKPHGVSEVFGKEIENRIRERIDQPVWIPWMSPNQPVLTQEAVLKYVESIVDQDYGNWGHILLPASWQARPGELTFDSKRFPDPAALVKALEKKGFRLALSIHPFVSVNAPAFNNGTQAGLWVRQSKSPYPALAQYNENHPSVVTDFSNPKAKEWFSSRLKFLQDTYKIDRFHLQPADAHALPAFHEYHMPLPGPDSVLIHFMASVSSISPPMSSEGAITPPLPPTFLTLGNGHEQWKGLETLIPRVLTLTMLGYPLIDIGIIGGITENGKVPQRELYIRWMQAATFLPAIQVNVLPRMYGAQMKDLVLEYNKLRKDLVLPRLHNRISSTLKDGTPLITPLALFDPKDPEAAKIGDQWILGKDLLVAPIIKEGPKKRDIYLPEGIWEDGIDKHLRRGRLWIRDYRVPLTKIAYFILKSMDD